MSHITVKPRENRGYFITALSKMLSYLIEKLFRHCILFPVLKTDLTVMWPKVFPSAKLGRLIDIQSTMSMKTNANQLATLIARSKARLLSKKKL